MKDIAIVTGASSGVGREFVRQIDTGNAGHIDEIWLIARRRERLEDIQRLTRHETRIFDLDLCDSASFDIVEKALENSHDTNVALLVNSAGFGKFGNFSSIGKVANTNMIRLNCLATVEMCYRTLMHMHAESRIINMSSAAAFLPLPHASIYSATKRFVLDFSRSLNAELKDVRIYSCAVCPKFMHTEFLDAPGDQQAVQNLCRVGFENVEDVVKTALHNSQKQRDISISSCDVAALHVATKILPTSLVLKGVKTCEELIH